LPKWFNLLLTILALLLPWLLVVFNQVVRCGNSSSWQAWNVFDEDQRIRGSEDPRLGEFPLEKSSTFVNQAAISSEKRRKQVPKLPLDKKRNWKLVLAKDGTARNPQKPSRLLMTSSQNAALDYKCLWEKGYLFQVEWVMPWINKHRFYLLSWWISWLTWKVWNLKYFQAKKYLLIWIFKEILKY